MKKLLRWLERRLQAMVVRHDCDKHGFFYSGELCEVCGRNRFTGEYNKFMPFDQKPPMELLYRSAEGQK